MVGFFRFLFEIYVRQRFNVSLTPVTRSLRISLHKHQFTPIVGDSECKHHFTPIVGDSEFKRLYWDARSRGRSGYDRPCKKLPGIIYKVYLRKTGLSFGDSDL